MLQAFRYNFGLTKQESQFATFNYAEKMEYWAFPLEHHGDGAVRIFAVVQQFHVAALSEVDHRRGQLLFYR
jgi:hypothetical protein